MNTEKLIKKALEAKRNAYVPYSKFHVGAVVVTENDEVYSGCNIENAAYTPTICAERTAIFKAISEGHRKIKTIVIVGDSNMTYPCGVCRQVLREFGSKSKIIIANSIDEYEEYTLDDLLPHSFGPEDLKESNIGSEKNV